ncbi:MAG: DUF4256 domain-containing protein [Verrucomicrobiota bacterium]
MPAKTSPEMPAAQREALLEVLASRFDKHPARHPGIRWDDVAAKLKAAPDKLRSLDQMEMTGGEPDVIGVDRQTGEYLFVDCSPESPKGRVSVCYDRAGLDSRKEHKPHNTAIDLATEMGVELLTPDQYRDLQKLGEFDLKTSSWVLTPPEIRKLGGALFGDRRYDTVFIYHNGAQSYYGARGFRAVLKV